MSVENAAWDGSTKAGAVPVQLSGDSGPERRSAVAPPWISDQRVTIPDRASGHLDRGTLTERCLPTKRRVTLLKAPGGFGKTALLAECCRDLSERGVATAWLSLDAQDEPGTLGYFIVQALRRAGLQVDDLPGFNGSELPAQRNWMRVLFRALENHGEKWVLALDELDKVKSRESVATLNALVRGAPSTLHLAMACRELPVGLDIAEPLFEDSAELLTGDDLRFSRSEIDRFFDLKLSRRELAAVAAESAGWPIALRIHRTARARQARERDVREVADNWVESRLWCDLQDDDRQFILDVGLFDWIDAELLEEVLPGQDPMRRLDGMAGVAGLLYPVRGSGGSVWRLHPLIRRHCTDRRRSETPQRCRQIHRKIATALARRGETADAIRHAAEAADAALVGQILTDAGGVQFWLREGAERLLAVDRYLTDEVLALYPRLSLARGVAQIFRGRMEQAKQTLVAEVPDLPELQSDAEFEVHLRLVQGMLIRNGSVSIGSEMVRAAIARSERMVEKPGIDPVVRGAMEAGLCMVHDMKAEFDAALDRGARARRWLGGRSPYLSVVVDLHCGQIAMAQGHVREAAHWYEKALRAAKRKFHDDPRLTLVGEVLSRELQVERNRVGDVDQGILASSEIWRYGAQLTCYTAASTVAVELTQGSLGVDRALSMVEEMWENALRADLSVIARYLAGLRVAILGVAGRVGEAERRWRADALPESDAGCIDLVRQNWREMEVLSCARLRLLALRGAFDEGRGLVRDLIALASARGLRRTWMRTLVVAVALEEAAGGRRAAMAHLAEFLRLYGGTDYAWPMVRERSVVEPVLNAFLDSKPGSSLRISAEALLAESKSEVEPAVPLLNARETEVLARLENQTDREIAKELGLTPEGVRYYIRKLFARLEVHNRFDGVQRARSLGLLPSE